MAEVTNFGSGQNLDAAKESAPDPRSRAGIPHAASALWPVQPRQMQAAKRDEVQDAFLEAVARLGTVSASAKEVGISRKTHYDWLETDPSYRERWDDAQEQYTERLEREMGRRAVEGVETGVWYQGERVGSEQKYSDTLLIFALKARRPAIYNNDRLALTGADGGPVQVQAVRSDALARLDPVQLAAIRQLNAAVAGALPAAEVVEEAADSDASAQSVPVETPDPVEPTSE